MVNNKIKTIFVSFGAGRTGWRQAAHRITREAQATGLFSEAISLDEEWLKSFEPKIYKIVMQFRARNLYKGFGYMTWKPAVLHWAKKTFPQANILYMDSGSHIDKSQYQIDRFKDLLRRNSEIGLAWRLPFHKEISWSKKELLIKLSASEIILQSGQIQSGFIYIPNNSFSTELISTWSELAMEKNGFYFSDELEISQNNQFIAHRHDQSSFSILWKLLGFGVQDDLTYPENLRMYPIVAVRNNTGLSATAGNKALAMARNFNLAKDKVLKRV